MQFDAKLEHGDIIPRHAALQIASLPSTDVVSALLVRALKPLYPGVPDSFDCDKFYAVRYRDVVYSSVQREALRPTTWAFVTGLGNDHSQWVDECSLVNVQYFLNVSLRDGFVQMAIVEPAALDSRPERPGLASRWRSSNRFDAVPVARFRFPAVVCETDRGLYLAVAVC